MTGTLGGAAIVADRYEIDLSRPLPDFDHESAKAFAAADLRDPGNSVYAMLPDPTLPLRLAAVTRLRRMLNNHLLRTLAWDTVDWPSDGRRRPAIILERSQGARLFPEANARIDPFREDALVRRFLQPMCVVLEDLSYTTVNHRNIRAENLFLDGTDVDRALILLGECVSAPPGYLQPAVYETIECAMSHPCGRGEGSVANDFYALGVTAAILLMGRNPLAGMDDERVIRMKLAQGSYAALLSNARVPAAMVEVFRGLLSDDPNDRWGLDKMQQWLGGRRASPKQQIRPSKAAVPFEIGGQPYNTARSVADALSRHWDEGLALVQNGEVDDWLRRGLADEDRTEAVNAAKLIGEGDENVSDATLARVIFALDPIGPVRYRAFRATLDGIAGLLAAKYADDEYRNAFVAIVQGRLFDFFLATNTRLRSDIFRLAGAFERLAPHVGKSEIGYGLERALYTLNGSIFCRSPLFETDYVADLAQVVPALDRLAKAKGGALDSVMDRHIAAFVAARMKTPVAPELRELRDASDHFGFALPATRILAYAQDQVNGDPAPALCNAVVAMLEPALERFHNRETRERIRNRLQEIAGAGRLSDIVAAVDDKEVLYIDDYNFRAAVAEYAGTEQQLQRIEFERENREALARTVSSQVASLFSGMAATVVVLVTILLKLV
jgi:hypothetical protein